LFSLLSLTPKSSVNQWTSRLNSLTHAESVLRHPVPILPSVADQKRLLRTQLSGKMILSLQVSPIKFNILLRITPLHHSRLFGESPMHPLLISRLLSQIAYIDIKEIKKILAEMNSAKSAISLTNNVKLAQEGLKVFIPAYRIIKSDIVKDIPQHIDESSLLEFFDAPCKVIEVRRLNRRIRIDDETKYISSRTVCLKFTGQILLRYVFFCRIRHEVFPYIPMVQVCFSYYRMGHISKSCRSKPRCIFCGREAHDANTICIEKDNPPHCINC